MKAKYKVWVPSYNKFFTVEKTKELSTPKSNGIFVRLKGYSHKSRDSMMLIQIKHLIKI